MRGKGGLRKGSNKRKTRSGEQLGNGKRKGKKIAKEQGRKEVQGKDRNRGKGKEGGKGKGRKMGKGKKRAMRKIRKREKVGKLTSGKGKRGRKIKGNKRIKRKRPKSEKRNTNEKQNSVGCDAFYGNAKGYRFDQNALRQVKRIEKTINKLGNKKDKALTAFNGAAEFFRDCPEGSSIYNVLRLEIRYNNFHSVLITTS